MQPKPVVPKPTETMKAKDLGEELMFYDRSQDRVHILNGTAREIFLLCDGERTHEQVVVVYAQKYGLDDEAAERDVRESVDQMCELGLLAT